MLLFVSATQCFSDSACHILNSVQCTCIQGGTTKSSATAEEPRDALCQLTSCHLLHNYTKNHIKKGL